MTVNYSVQGKSRNTPSWFILQKPEITVWDRLRCSFVFHGVRLMCVWTFNPLRPNKDLSQTSHCNIKGV